MGSTSTTTVMVIEPIAAPRGLPGELSCEYHAPTVIIVLIMIIYVAGEIAAIIVGVVIIIMGLLVILAIAFALKLKNDKHHHVIRSLKSELRWGMQQLLL